MVKSRVLVTSILMLILTVFANAQTKSEIKLTKQDRELASEYRFKAVIYSLAWNQSEYKFEAIEDVSYFKQLKVEDKSHGSCCLVLVDVTLRDGVSFLGGLHKFHATQYLDVDYNHDSRKIVVIRLDTKRVIWKNN
ncbi:MAG: hypothetical protein Q8R55_01575 [Candidatus Taylorbacteria bacterium]|nr:hypothetical protein [Candidatus Taylorbacteria bacterium]